MNIVRNLPRYGRKGFDQNAVKTIEEYESNSTLSEYQDLASAVKITMTNKQIDVKSPGY